MNILTENEMKELISYSELVMQADKEGKTVVLVNGKPVLEERRSPTQEELAVQVRLSRDRRLEACTWIVERHRDQLEAGGATTLTVDEYQVWLAYRQALRDLPQQPGFPWAGPDDLACPWPKVPRL